MKKSHLLGLSLMAAAAMPQTTYAEATLYVYQYNSVSTQNTHGLYSMNPDGSDMKLLWKDEYSSNLGCNMVSGWIRDGKLCGIVSLFNALQVDNSRDCYVERDLLTGEVLKEVKLNGNSSDWTNFYIQSTYCPYDDFIYGYGLNPTRTAFAFKKAPATALNETVIVRDLNSYTSGLCFNEDYGTLAGVFLTKQADYNYSAEFVQIDINTGISTTLFSINTDITIDYQGRFGMVWDSTTQKYLWNCYNEEGSSVLYEIDPVKKTCEEITNFPDQFWGTFFVIQGDEYSYSASAASAVTDMSYTKTATSATLTFKLPTTFSNGTTTISDDVNYTVFEGSRKLTSGSGAPGSEITTTAIPLSEGTHFLRIVPEAYGIDGVSSIMTVVMGSEVPSSPTDIRLTETTLSWEPVTLSQHGNPITGVTYSVSVNGISLGTTADTSIDVSDYIDTDGALTAYVASVTAVCDGVMSKPADSNKLIAGKPWEPPFEVTPDQKDFGLCTVQDIDGDGSKWTLYSRSYDNEPVFLSGNNATLASEDWIFFPAFTGSKTSVYTFSFDASLAQEDLVNGAIEVMIGTAPSKEGMKRTLLPSTPISNYDPMNFYADFMIDGELAEAKALYIGLAVSSREGENSPVMVNNVKVTETATDLNRPAAVTELTAAASDTSSDMATVSFKLPVTLLDGTAIDPSTEVKARISVIGMQNTTVTGAPGETITTDVQGYSGYNVIVVTPQVGDAKGLGTDITCHLGFGRPGPVRNLRVSYSEDDLGLRLDWDAPDTDYYGEPAEGGTFSYKVWQLNSENKYELAVEVPIGLSFADVTMSENFNLFNMQMAVSAVNNEGEGPLTSTIAQIGEPYKMPLNEDFNGDTYTYTPFTIFNSRDYSQVEYHWGNPEKLGLPSKYNDASAGDLIYVNPIENAVSPISRIWIPKFSTTGYKTVNLELLVWTGADAAETSITGYAYGMDAAEEIKTLPRDKEGFNKVIIPLPASMCDNSWVQIAINSAYPSQNSLFLMGGYSVVSGTGGVEGVTETLLGSIIGGEGNISFTGFEGKTAEIFTLDGRKAASVNLTAGYAVIPVEKGIYLVKAGNQTAKVVVR